jgi:hypothetical protein
VSTVVPRATAQAWSTSGGCCKSSRLIVRRGSRHPFPEQPPGR